MDSSVEELYQHFVTQPKMDAFPSETPGLRAQLCGLPLEQRDAVEHLISNAGITAFREGLRLGLLLGTECLFPPHPLP